MIFRDRVIRKIPVSLSKGKKNTVRNFFGRLPKGLRSVESVIAILGIIVAILLWFFPPEPLRAFISGSDSNPEIAEFTGSAHDEYYQDPTDMGVSEFMDFVENRIGETVYIDVEARWNS